MECPRCNIEMTEGYAIDENIPANCLGGRVVPYKWGEMPMVYCHKCPQCGHSEHLENYVRGPR